MSEIQQSKLVYLSEEQFEELKLNGTITANGHTIVYQENDVYAVEVGDEEQDIIDLKDRFSTAEAPEKIDITAAFTERATADGEHVLVDGSRAEVVLIEGRTIIDSTGQFWPSNIDRIRSGSGLPDDEDICEFSPITLGQFDTFDPKTGEIRRQTGELVFDGTETWSFEDLANSSADIPFYRAACATYQQMPDAGTGVYDFVCNKYPCEPYDATNPKAVIRGHGSGQSRLWIYLPIATSSITTLEQWKAYLAEQYAAATPLAVAYKKKEATVEYVPVKDCGYKVFNGGYEEVEDVVMYAPRLTIRYSLMVDGNKAASKEYVNNGLAGKFDKAEAEALEGRVEHNQTEIVDHDGRLLSIESDLNGGNGMYATKLELQDGLAEVSAIEDKLVQGEIVPAKADEANGLNLYYHRVCVSGEHTTGKFKFIFANISPSLDHQITTIKDVRSLAAGLGSGSVDYWISATGYYTDYSHVYVVDGISGADSKIRLSMTELNGELVTNIAEISTAGDYGKTITDRWSKLYYTAS